MTISSTSSKISYNGNGSTTSFSFPYKCYKQTDVKVYSYNLSTKIESLLTFGTDYTVSGTLVNNEYPTGYNIVFSTAPSNQIKLTLVRILPLTQETTYVEGDTFPAKSHEQALDRGVILSQQLQEVLSRTPSVPISSTLPAVTLPLEQAGKLIGWNATATNLENKEPTVLGPATIPSLTGNANKSLVVAPSETSFVYKDAAIKDEQNTFTEIITCDKIGIGSSSIASTSNIDTLTVSGFYRITASGTTSPTPGSNFYTIIHQSAGTSDFATQIAVNSQNPDLVYTRAKNSGTWGNWSRLGAYTTNVSLASIVVYGPNGFGSTDTRIRTYSGTPTVSGNITVSSTTTEGLVVTIVNAGVYCLDVSDYATGAANNFGISANATLAERSQALSTILPKVVTSAFGSSINSSPFIGKCSITRPFAAGTVLRVHFESASAGTPGSLDGYFRLFQIS